MARACGIEYAEAARDAEQLTVAGVVIPVASLATLIRTKDTVRPSDAADRRYLDELLRAESEDPWSLARRASAPADLRAASMMR